MKRYAPGIYLVTNHSSEFQIILADDSEHEQLVPFAQPVDHLLAVMEYDYSEYRREVEKLYDYTLFDEKYEPLNDALENFLTDVFTLPTMLEDFDPASWFTLGVRLHQSLRPQNDGTVLFTIQTLTQLIHILEEPIRTQIRLRNIFEVAFDGMERASQRKRYERLKRIYPDVVSQYFAGRPLECDKGQLPFGNLIEYSFHSPYGLYLFELLLYFQQDEQRIARCECCGRYFIPKTKKETRYCDRVINDLSCKTIGPNLKRKVGPEQDQALKIYNQLYARMAERLHRYESAADWARQNLFQMDIQKYNEWMDVAHKARQDYLSKSIPADEFLHRIDIYHELDSYDTEKQENAELLDTPYGLRLKNDIDFDPEEVYPETFMSLDLRASAGEDSTADGYATNPEWKYYTREEMIRKDREGHEPLREKYLKAGQDI